SGANSNLNVVPGGYTIMVRSGSNVSASTSFTVGAPQTGGIIWGDIALDRNANGSRDAGDDLVAFGVGLTATGPAADSPPHGSVTDARGRCLFMLPAG